MDALLATLIERADDEADGFTRAVTVLRAGLPEGLEFEAAWYGAMRAITPPRQATNGARATAAVDRDLLRETKPFWQAAYEHRAPEPAELKRAAVLCERRLADVNGHAAAA